MPQPERPEVTRVSTSFGIDSSPWENGYNESFNGKLRDEFLNGEIFYTLPEAVVLVEQWRRMYNTVRPHSAYGGLPQAPETIKPSAWFLRMPQLLGPPLGCENDVGGRFTVCPVPDSHGTRRVSAEAAVSYASSARPDVAGRADEAEMGATPQAEGLVRAWGWVCFHTPVPALQGSLPVHQSLAGRPSACAASGVLRYR